jgi:hypothetical protein
MRLLPAGAVIVPPPQVPVTTLGVEITRPAGNVSENCRASSVTTGHSIGKPFPPFIDHLAFIHIVVGIGHAVKAAADSELVKMVMLPVHDDLQDLV